MFCSWLTYIVVGFSLHATASSSDLSHHIPLVITSRRLGAMGDGSETISNTLCMEIIVPMCEIQAQTERKADIYVSACQMRADVLHGLWRPSESLHKYNSKKDLNSSRL